MANNPYVNKVVLADGTSLIDISDSTVTADKILEGYIAYGADGQKLTGTATGGGDVPIWQGSDYYVYLSDTAPAPVGIYVDSDGYVVLDMLPPYPDGNNLEYGLTDGTLPLAGVGKADYMILAE